MMMTRRNEREVMMLLTLHLLVTFMLMGLVDDTDNTVVNSRRGM
jgi:hypothetical protein